MISRICFFKIDVRLTQHKNSHFKVDRSLAFSAFTVLRDHHIYLVPRYFHHLKIKPVPLVPASFCFWWPPIRCILCPGIYLLCTCHINGVMKYVAFCVWLPSLSTMFSGFIHLVACVRTSFLLTGWVIFHCLTILENTWLLFYFSCLIVIEYTYHRTYPLHHF